MVGLKAFRISNKLNQAELGEFLGIKKSFISKIENGKERLPAEKFQKLLHNNKGWDTSLLMESGTIIQKIGDHSENNTQIAGDAELAVCQQKVQYLERILEEKERMIQILLEKK